MPQKRPTNNPYAEKRRRAKKTKWMSLIVLLALVVVLFVVALLLAGGQQQEESSSLPVSSAPSSSVPSSSKPALASSSSSSSVEIPQATGPYDVEGIPPLFNASNPLPDDWQLDLIDIGNGQQMQREAAAAFTAMQEAAAADGITLTPISGYRSNAQQTTNFNNAIARHKANGLSDEEAERETRRYYALPGTSEHEAGLAIDINLVDDAFAESDAYEWLQQHCNEYGFLYRYRRENEPITGIAWEPWHYRYVGANHAAKIEQRGETLEEYVNWLGKTG